MPQRPCAEWGALRVLNCSVPTTVGGMGPESLPSSPESAGKQAARIYGTACSKHSHRLKLTSSSLSVMVEHQSIGSEPLRLLRHTPASEGTRGAASSRMYPLVCQQEASEVDHGVHGRYRAAQLAALQTPSAGTTTAAAGCRALLAHLDRRRTALRFGSWKRAGGMLPASCIVSAER